MAPKPIHDGDLLGRGIGPEAARRIQLDALERRAADCGRVTVTAALQVQDTALWEFMAWYRRLERESVAQSADAGLIRGGGGGDGIPLSHEQRLAVEVPILLLRLMEAPVEVIEALDKGLGMC